MKREAPALPNWVGAIILVVLFSYWTVPTVFGLVLGREYNTWSGIWRESGLAR